MNQFNPIAINIWFLAAASGAAFGGVQGYLYALTGALAFTLVMNFMAN